MKCFNSVLTLILLSLTSISVLGQTSSLPIIGQSNSQLLEADSELNQLRERKRMFRDILSTSDEIMTLVENTRYSSENHSLVDTIPSKVSLIYQAIDEDGREDAILNVYRLIREINRTNLDKYLRVQRKLTELKKYPQNPSDAERYRDDKLQLLRAQIMRKIQGEYQARAADVPEFVYVDGFGEFDRVKTLENYDSIRYKITPSFLDDLRRRASENDFNHLTNIYINTIKDFKADIKIEESQVDQDISRLESRYDNLLEKQIQVDRQILWFFGGVMVFILVLYIVPPLLYNSKLNKEYFTIMLEQRLTLRLITVFLLIVIILILGITTRLESDVIATLLGGISAYVLKDEVAKRRAPKEGGESDKGEDVSVE